MFEEVARGSLHILQKTAGVARKKFQDIRAYLGYAAGLPSFLRRGLSREEAEGVVRCGMEQREANFLRLLRLGVFGRHKSPYSKLLKLADCHYADLESSVRRRGLLPTLRRLREEGVYFTFDELKGRCPVERHGQSFPVTSRDFVNPFLQRAYQTESGGSTGRSTRVAQDLDHLSMQAAHFLLAFEAHGVLNDPHGLWRGVLPDGSGLNNLLRCSQFGRPPEKWFTQNNVWDPHLPWRFKLASLGTTALGRLSGVPLPWPQAVPIDRAEVVADWMSQTLVAEGSCLLSAPVSRALRVALAAEKAGRSLEGATFIIAGEPVTAAKVAGILRSGASYFTTYGFSEGGRVALGCANPASLNDLHLLSDAFEVFSHPRLLPHGEHVPVLNFTSLLLTAPMLLLNVEMDDYGVVEERRCGCSLEGLGYHTHIREVHSYRKLTGEGVSLVGQDMVDLLESFLPGRFGGSPLDYQMMETEDADGFTRLSLLVSPRVALADESQVIPTLLGAMPMK